ncbi:MAG: DUF4363 family protein [Clostridia bacterium]|nr:DUF4363 family protein [Clostridia bacterium]
MKEIIGIIVIVSIVCATSFLLQKYLNNTSDEILAKLESLKNEIEIAQVESSNTKVTEMSEDVIKKWDEMNDIWSMLVVHQELDNIKLSILEVKGAVSTSSFDDALEEIDKAIFLVGHIKEKEAFKLKNVF